MLGNRRLGPLVVVIGGVRKREPEAGVRPLRPVAIRVTSSKMAPPAAGLGGITTAT
jgi:hypothetical protein